MTAMTPMPDEMNEGQKAIVRQIAIEAFEHVLPLFLMKERESCPAVKFVRRLKYWAIGIGCGCLGLGIGIGYITAQQVIDVAKAIK